MATAKKKSRKKAAKKATKKAAAKKTATKKAPGKSGKDARTSAGALDDKAGKSETAGDAKEAVGRDDSAKKRQAAALLALEKSRNYAASGLAAQVTESLIDELRALDKLWHQTPEAMQAVVISRITDRVGESMEKAVQVLAAVGHKALICNLASVTFKEGVRAIITIPPNSDKKTAHALADYATRDVVLVLADPGIFMQGLQDVKPDADQRKLI